MLIAAYDAKAILHLDFLLRQCVLITPLASARIIIGIPKVMDQQTCLYVPV